MDSATLNVAYETLCDPLKRARHLLSLQGVDLIQENVQFSDEFFEELISINQQIYSTFDQELVALINELNQTHTLLLNDLSVAFKNKNIDKAVKIFQKLTFYSSALKRAKEKLTV